MARITLSDSEPSRAPALRGAIYIYTRRGQVIAAKWPRKRGKNLHPTTREQTAWFTAVRKLSKWYNSKQVIAARLATARTPLLPGDLLMSATAGRLLSITNFDGTYFRSARAMSEVSESLDLISNVPGTILIRGVDEWEGIMLPALGANWFYTVPTEEMYNMSSTSLFAWKGIVIDMFADFQINAAMACFLPVPNQKYAMALCELNPQNAVTAVVVTPEISPVDTIVRNRLFQLIGTMRAGKRYAIIVGQTTGTGTSPLQCSFPRTSIIQIPASRPIQARLAKTTPSIGDIIDTNGDQTGGAALGIQGAF